MVGDLYRIGDAETFGIVRVGSLTDSTRCYAPGLKGPSWAFIFESYVCLSVCEYAKLKFRPAYIQSAIVVQLRLRHSIQTWHASSAEGYQHHLPLGVGQGNDVGQDIGLYTVYRLWCRRGIYISQTYFV